MDVRNLPTSAATARIPMTAEAFRRLGEEVARLGGELVLADAAARCDAGNGHEAAPAPTAAGEYHVLARRLDGLKRVLEAAEVVEPDGRVVLGTRATVRFYDGETEEFELVAPGEGDPAAGRVSHESPLGSAIFGRRADETASLLAPAGAQLLTIVAVAAVLFRP